MAMKTTIVKAQSTAVKIMAIALTIILASAAFLLVWNMNNDANINAIMDVALIESKTVEIISEKGGVIVTDNEEEIGSTVEIPDDDIIPV